MTDAAEADFLRDALQLAENQLPDVVGRLRRGENAGRPPSSFQA